MSKRLKRLDRERRHISNRQIDFVGWILFVMSAIGFIIASVGNFWALAGSVFFLLACVVFLIPFFRASPDP